MTFYIGQKVVFVDDSPMAGFHQWREAECPKIGAVYTVRRYFIDIEGTPVLWLDEICRDHASVFQWGPDVGYGARRFRPIVERKTSIAIFQRMLTPTDKVSA